MATKALSVLLGLLAVYLAWWSASEETPAWLVGSVLCALVAVGLFCRMRWAAYAWYLMALLASVSWLASVIFVARRGWPYERMSESLISLLPGGLLLLLCVIGSLGVAQSYRGNPDEI